MTTNQHEPGEGRRAVEVSPRQGRLARWTARGRRVAADRPLLAAFAISLVIIFLGAAIGQALLAGSPAPGRTALVTDASVSSLPATTTLKCNPVHALSPSAVYITVPVPKSSLAANGTIFAQAEFQILNFTSADVGTVLYFPSLFYKFPLAAGGNLTMLLSATSVTIKKSGWSKADLLARSDVEAKGAVFKSGGEASLTSMKLAIMSSALYGNVTVEFKWRWGNTPTAGGGLVYSPWSTPTTQSAGINLPSIFYPAQYVSFLNSTGSTATIGTAWNATLGGNVAGEYFFLEWEGGGGKVGQAHGQTAPANATRFNVTIEMLNYVSALTPGLYLIHIHDSCGALLYNKLVKAVYAPQASVQFFTVPGNCGTINFNGTKYANGTVGNFTPSSTPYTFSLTACHGYTFSNWTTTGALHITSGSSIQISNSGTFTVRFR